MPARQIDFSKLSARESQILTTYIQRWDEIDLTDYAHAKQQEFIRDSARFKSLISCRQTGKSEMAALYLLHECMRNPKTLCLFAAKTNGSAKDIIWKRLKELKDRYNIQCRFFTQKQMIEFSNGSSIKVCGLDTDMDDAEKLRGPAYSLIIIDEAGFFQQDLEAIFTNICLGLLKSKQGTCCIIGTPGYSTHIKKANGQLGPHYFYQITDMKDPIWKQFKWLPQDNPHNYENHLKDVELLLTNNPAAKDTAYWKREYEGEWANDSQYKVFNFSEAVNVVTELPKDQDYIYAGGCDWGYVDPNAFPVWALGLKDHVFYCVDYFVKPQLQEDDIGHALTRLMGKYPVTQWYADHKPGLIEFLRVRYMINIIKADKTEKRHFVELMNQDLMAGRIKIVVNDEVSHLRLSNHQLIKEMRNLEWSNENPMEFHKGCEDHVVDSSYYCWRHAYRYRFKPEEVKFTGGLTPEELWAQKMEEDLERQVRKKNSNNLFAGIRTAPKITNLR